MSAAVATLPPSSSATRGLVSVSAVPINIFSTRPSRSVARVNYAEASDESLGGGGGSGRKRKASAFSAAAPRSMPQRPKSLLKMLNNSAAGKRTGSKKGSDSDESEESDEDEAEESDEENVKSGSKALRTVDFGAAKKKQASGPTPKYVTNFVIACEQICVRDAKLLAAFHAAVRKVPLNTPAALPQIVDAFNKVLSPRVVERIQTQLNALGPHGAPADMLVAKSARTPLMSDCSGCKRQSYLVSICSVCKKTDKLSLAPFLDWRKVLLKQRELDADSARQAGNKEERAKKKLQADNSGADSESPSPSPEPLSSAAAADSLSLNNSNKRQKATPSSSPASGANNKLALSAADAALADVEQPDRAWIDNAREQLSLRAIQWIRGCMMKCSKEHFAFSGGDIIFLLRNAIFKGTGEVSKQARAVVSEMLGRWDDSTCTIISDNSEPAHVMVYAECLHAKVEMQWEADKGRLDELVERLRSAVGAHCAEDILRFDASRFQDRLPTQAYCKPCGEFQKGSKGVCPNQGCGLALTAEHDFEFLCESLVWTSLFRELRIAPVVLADASVSFEHMLNLMKLIRPYRSLDERGLDSYKLQCYFLTHLTFVLTKWGACTMSPRHLFVEEYLFLLSNMDVVIRMKDAELVGEFLQALHILDTPHDHPAMQKGYHFLIGAEKKGKMRGNWVPSSAPFYQRYHAAYCGIIGLAEFVFDPSEKFPEEWAKYFE